MSKRLSNSTLRTLAAGMALAVALPAALPAQLLGPPPIAGKDDTRSRKQKKQQRANVEWLWQYSPPPVEGRENDLIQDPHFQPFLAQNFTAPQAFWGPQNDDKAGARKTLAATIYDFLAIPNKVLADDNRYITATGCVFHFCASRGLLWVDLNATRDTVAAFAAIDWIRESKVTTDPAAEYTLWIFPNQAMSFDRQSQSRIPNALLYSIRRWAAEPDARTHIVPRITTGVLVDPDGTPHPFNPEALDILDPAQPPKITSPEEKAK